jgi:hypothetical protein
MSSFRLLTSCTLALLWSASSLTSQQFTRDASALPAQNVWTDGVLVADVDGDGDMDILFANGSSYGGGGAQPQHYFKNNGSGVFSPSHDLLNVSNFNAKMVIAEDFDNDGDLDLMYAPEGPYPSTTQVPRMLVNQGGLQGGTEGAFVNDSAARLPNLTMASFCVAAGDIDDDGDLDVVFTNGATFSGQASQARLYLNDGNGFFTDATSSNLPTDLYNAQDVTLFDYDGDLDVDIALAGKGGSGKRARLYLNDGGVFTISNAMNGLGSGATYEIDWGDLDGDGDFDAAVQSIAGQSEGWGRNDGPITALPENTFPTPNGGDDNEMGCMDYDSDGDLDVFVGSLGATEKMYRNDGGGTFVNQQGQIESQGDATLDMGFGDLDGDGDIDFVTGQGESGNFTNKVYDNGGTADVTDPTIFGKDDPKNWGIYETVFHVQAQDALSDDGHTNMTAAYSYTTNVGSGSGTATRMGGGLFRAAVPTAIGQDSIDLDFTVTDWAGNSSVSSASVVEGGVWTNLGGGTVGLNGMPELHMSGPLLAGGGSTLDLAIKKAPAGSLMLFWASLSPVATPLWGGTIHVFPADVKVILFADGDGEFNVSIPWAAGVPSATVSSWQVLVQDGSTIFGATLSNAVGSLTP